MCYILLSLMGIPSIVATGNSLTVDIKREMASTDVCIGSLASPVAGRTDA